MNDPFESKAICKILLSAGVISNIQAKFILKKEPSVKNTLEKKQKEKFENAAQKINFTINIIDVIVSLKLEREDSNFGILDEETIYALCANAWKIPYKKIDPLKLDLNTVTTIIPRTFAMKHLVMPVDVKNGYLTVATSNPFNMEVKEDITRVSNLQVKFVVSAKTDILKLISEFFGFKRSIAAAEDQFTKPIIDLGNLEQYVKLKSPDELPSNDHHIINAVNHLLSYAFEQRASDIHIEPKRKITLVRMRIDGVLHTAYKLPKNVHIAVVSRIKNLSRLNMAEKRKPQDGRIKTDKDGIEVEIRVSTIPVAFGEKIVMRIMDPNILFQDMEKLGFTKNDLEIYNGFIKSPNGIILVCGPTGSGKSTTLYSTLRKISTPEVNITTIEDPIEMVYEDFNQISVQNQIGIGFATILRNILRQDPDIIMVGEMRDLETAHNAIQAALTGHLVFSTLHTNDAPSSILRLLDLGVPYFLIQSTLIGILAQRLVRKICNYCKETFEIDSSQLLSLGIDIKKEGKVTLSKGKGCLKCRGTGYLGRIGIYEILNYSDELKTKTVQNVDLNVISQLARKDGMKTLRQSAVQKLLKGVTTYQEVLRVTWEKV